MSGLGYNRRVSKADLDNALERLNDYSDGERYPLGWFELRSEYGQWYVSDKGGDSITTRGCKRVVFDQIQTILRYMYSVKG